MKFVAQMQNRPKREVHQVHQVAIMAAAVAVMVKNKLTFTVDVMDWLTISFTRNVPAVLLVSSFVQYKLNRIC